jgi:hypothetical protein
MGLNWEITRSSETSETLELNVPGRSEVRSISGYMQHLK